MKLIILSVVIIALVPVEMYGRVIFECPPADQIHPCTCSAHPHKVVKCDNVRNLDIVQNALENRFQTPLPSLKITNLHMYQLPHHAFQNISSKKLELKGSSFRHIDDDAFDGQDSLGLLILSEDRLTEFPTEALKRLSGLRTLSLAGNFIMKIEDDSMVNLTKLRNLILSDNRLSSIESNSFSRYLQTLFFSRNLLTTLNGSVKNLHNLDWLDVSNNRLVSVKEELSGLSQLSHLSLEGNNLRDISGSFDDLKSLKRLNLAYNSLEKVEGGLFPLTKLRHLNLSNNYITEISEELFQKLNNVETLDLSGNYIHGICRSIKPLKNLEKLDLSNTNLHSLEYECFQDMRNIRSLDLSQNQLVDIDAITAHSFPNLKTLNLQKNMLQSFRYGLKNLKFLNELDIGENNFRSIKIHQLMHNTELKKLRIEDNPWDCSDYLLEVLQNLEKKMVSIVGKPICYQMENSW